MSKYFYIHVPKTGGTSIDAYFKAAFPEDSVTHCEHMVAHGRHAEISQKTYASGHVPYSTLLRSNVTYDKLIISYRDPFAQLSSHIRWLALIGQDEESAMYKNHPEAIRLIGKRLNAVDFDDARAVAEYVRTMSLPELGLFDNFLVRYLCPYAVKNRTRGAHLIASLSTLEDAAYLVLTDTLHADISILFRKEGLVEPMDALHENTGRANLTKERVAARKRELEPLFQMDQTLYEAIAKSSVRTRLHSTEIS